ncbi:MAG: cytochrome C peroxidase [Acidobacteria bacterium]|nr:cytochrome C peroxidase [Acidobacteriota bacterium]
MRSLVAAIGLLLACFPLLAQLGGLRSLRSVSLPQPTELDKYVRDTKTLAVLGKALFWDVQIGSDGLTACATCHFHAGADHRLQNQLSSPHDSVRQVTVNQVLEEGAFPFRLLSNPADNRSGFLRDNRQVAGSAGIIYRKFQDVTTGTGADLGAEEAGPAAFVMGGLKVRQVTARNTPTVINALFNVVNFWDGRASNVFTGATPFGDSDTTWKALVVRDGALVSEPVRMDNASLASQAVGPPLNEVEMSYEGRTWNKLARKTLSVAPLARQRVAADDSLLGAFANPDGPGLLADSSYASMIRAAFRPEYWESETLDADGYTQMEQNFPLFFGLAIQAYEALLVSDESRFDKFAEGDSTALTAQERTGLQVFNGGSECHECHQGGEFTAASFSNVRNRSRSTTPPGGFGLFRTGVTPVADDLGAAAKDSFGLPLFPAARGNNAQGVFKSPTLRNVELTGPFFHDGSQATLEQVVDFYGRRGDFPGDGNLGPGMNRINMSAADRVALVAFLKALTDDRVRFERAPFDHPELCVPVGHAEADDGGLQPDGTSESTRLSAADKWALIPAVGRSGNSAPLQTFEELLKGVGADGSRAHTMTEVCSPVR